MKKGKSRGPGAAGEVPSPPERRGRTLLILHIEDSIADQVLFQAACACARVPIISQAFDGVDKAKAYLESLVQVSQKQEARWPDLVLLDILMGDRSGMEILEYIRAKEELKGLPVVILTGHPDPKFIRQAQALQANSYVLKPKQFHHTIRLVSSLYAQWSGHGGSAQA
jgi:two-component system, response regulator